MSASRKNIMLGTAGHVDHGKTALVKLLTGCETDTLAEEKQRGLTIDLGFAPCRMADERIVGIVDVPGHVDFIRNMVAGAHGIDVVILVVAADDGIMPQTHEHLHILTLMGLRHGLVALTKVDLVDETRRQFVERDLRRLLAGTFLDGAPICPVSNVTGAGFDGFFDSLNRAVDACEERRCVGAFRLWVEDAFSIRGAGTVITGIPSSGRVRVGDRLHLLPTGLTSHVRGLQVYGENAAEGRAGECVALNVPDIDHDRVRRGMLLAASDAQPPVAMAEGELRVLGSIQGKIEDYPEVQLHVGTAAVSARVAMLETTEMIAGQKQMVQLRLAEPLPLAPGERFVVRGNVADAGHSGLTTIGGGRILGVSNMRLRRKKQWTLDALSARRDAIDDPARWLERLLKESSAPVTATSLLPEANLGETEIAAILSQLAAAGRAIATPGGAWLHREVVQAAAREIFTAIEAFHAAHPQRAGIGREELLDGPAMNAGLFDLAVESLVRDGRIERNGTVLARAGWSARVSDPDRLLSDRLSARLQQAGWSPPAAEELAAEFKEPVQRVGALMRLLIERGVLVRLDDRIVMHRDAIESGRQKALELFARAPGFSTMEYRDALGVSRKYAVPLLDYLDKIRFTVRTGNQRAPGIEARKRLSPDAAGAPKK